MPRYVAFLRGVSPMNAKMPDLKRCFESAGFTNVTTVLSSGNVVFDAQKGSASVLEQQAESAMKKQLDRTFFTIVRPVKTLLQLLEANPYAAFLLPPAAKRVVTFLREPPPAHIVLPPEVDGARILATQEREVFSAYVPNPANGPVFMTLIEKTFGKDVTTRTWDTVKRCVAK
jgi:uncharacterized protein (DUF1697 family)